jgi:hypothetical protein
VEKRNDHAGGRTLHPVCGYRSQAVKGCEDSRVRSIVAEDNSSWTEGIEFGMPF